MCAAFGWTAAELPQQIRQRLVVLPISALGASIKLRYGANLKHGSKNRTVNFSKLLKKVPQHLSSDDYNLERLLRSVLPDR